MFLRDSKLSRKKREAGKAFLYTQMVPKYICQWGSDRCIVASIWSFVVAPEERRKVWRKDSRGGKSGWATSPLRTGQNSNTKSSVCFSVSEVLSPQPVLPTGMSDGLPLCDFLSSCVVVGGHLGTCSSNRRRVCCLMLAQKPAPIWAPVYLPSAADIILAASLWTMQAVSW